MIRWKFQEKGSREKIMFHIALYQPEIPPNTGNVIRLCANTGAKLHLIHPLGFNLDEKRVRRAGLDYHELADVIEHKNYDGFLKNLSSKNIYACTTKGKQSYADVNFKADDVLLFGPETRGLPDKILSTFTESHKIRIPMKTCSRSLNLSNAVAIILYEAWRQQSFQHLFLD